MIVGAIASALAPNLGFLLVARFVLGLGIGGDYPVSAVLMSEYSNRSDRGRLVGLVFSMQALGLIVGPLVALGLLAAAPVNAASPPSLLQSDWAQASVPGSACGSGHAVTLHDWTATVGSTRWRSAPRVAVTAGHAVIYGELAPGLAAAGCGRQPPSRRRSQRRRMPPLSLLPGQRR